VTATSHRAACTVSPEFTYIAIVRLCIYTVAKHTDLLASLGDLLEDVVVRLVGLDDDLLRREVYCIFFNVCESERVVSRSECVLEGGNELSALLRARVTAPEQPPQVMVTLNL